MIWEEICVQVRMVWKRVLGKYASWGRFSEESCILEQILQFECCLSVCCLAMGSIKLFKQQFYSKNIHCPSVCTFEATRFQECCCFLQALLELCGQPFFSKSLDFGIFYCSHFSVFHFWNSRKTLVHLNLTRKLWSVSWM